MKWIPVESKLPPIIGDNPKDHELVLLRLQYVSGKCKVEMGGRFEYEGSWFWGRQWDDEIGDNLVTHWCPIPDTNI